MLRVPVWILLCAAFPVATAQIHLSAGGAVGLPLTDTLNSSSINIANGVTSSFSSYRSVTKRILAGPVLRLDFTPNWSVEFDALYQRVDYDSAIYQFGPGSLVTRSFEATIGNRWQFPLLVQYTRHHVFVETGIAISHIGDSNSVVSITAGSSGTTSTSGPGPSETQPGVDAGSGTDVRFLRGRLRPEIRYSRWLGQSRTVSAPLSGFQTNRNEISFLLNWTR
jgi:hypothetical protein